MSKKCFILVVCLALFSFALIAQEYNTETGLGFHFGTSTGSGYSMRWMNDKQGIQGTFGAYTTGSNDKNFPDQMSSYDLDDDNRYWISGRETAVILGVNYLRILDEYRFGRFYIMAGGSYKYLDRSKVSMQYEFYSYSDQIPGSKLTSHVIEDRWSIGVGPGFDWALSTKIRLAVEIPITIDWKHEIIMYIPSAGIYYYFK